MSNAQLWLGRRARERGDRWAAVAAADPGAARSAIEDG